MSTRSAIARPAGDGWEGRYHHFDGYPTSLGRTLWTAYHEHFKGDIEAMQRYLIDEHPAGWSTINGADLSLPPGYGLGGNAPACYCHGGRSEPASKLIREDGTCRDCDPLFIEWAYVLAPGGMAILEAREAKGDPKASKDGYRHFAIAFVRWAGPEPDWEHLESRS